MHPPSDVTFRLAQSEDSDAVRRVNGAAFGGRRVPDMVDALVAAGNVVASLVADRAGHVVGHVQLSRCWIDARERLVEVVTLSPLAVEPSSQRQGIGTALVAAALQTARERGEPAVFLEGDPNFYGPRGFSTAKSLGFGRPSPRIPEPGFQVALFDPELPRGPFVYCQTFWTQDCVGLRDPQLASVEANCPSNLDALVEPTSHQLTTPDEGTSAMPQTACDAAALPGVCRDPDAAPAASCNE